MAAILRRVAPLLVTGGIALSLLAGTLTLGTLAARGHLSRHEAIEVVTDDLRFPKTAAKLMYVSDLEDSEGRALIASDRFDMKVHDRIWVVAVAGAAAGFSCPQAGTGPCHPPITWTLAVVQDQPGTTMTSMVTGGYTGHWPPYFDALPDLASGPAGWFLS
jgi:hypothetical protein